ncbi:MAG: ABC transporter ATP-binding protein [Trueperaceae bacterium]|jgi:spermidine/putrescine transport system ATP-binding protein|nr:ABC transporter ATP-binding protein [Truepera sp.]
MASVPAVQIRSLVKEFVDPRTRSSVRAVNDVDLDIHEGEFFAMLGPSGCGKTTTLRVIAGFEEPSSGELLLSGRSMRGIPSFHRPVNTVFQDYALFPHMTVLQNVLFGLRMARVPAAEARKRALEALDMVRLPNVEGRKPLQLSGGQRQRVALARALVNRPSVLLLDEPLGALDLKLRRAMQFELKRLQQQVGITFIYVTHDQEEALTMADRIAVMNFGEVLQVGRADEIYERPMGRFVADFIGETNFLAGVLEGKSGPNGRVRLAGGTVLAGVLRDQEVSVGSEVALALRPEKLAVESAAAGDLPPLGSSHSELPGKVAGVHYLGTDARYLIEVAGGVTVIARVQNQQHGYAGMLPEGTPVRLTWLTEYGSVLA